MTKDRVHQDTVIIGAGLAGLSAAYHIGDSAHVFEAKERVGGKATSETFEGFTFDVTGHWLHLRDPEIRRWILDIVGEENFIKISRLSRVWSHGVYTQYPFQGNLYGLPADVVKECLVGAVESRIARVNGSPSEPERFDDWIRHYFGDGIASHFMVPYNAKLWGVSAKEITSQWCQRFVPKPDLEDIIAGAVGCKADAVGYNATFLYPKTGGIQIVANAIARNVGDQNITLNAPVKTINFQEKCVTFENGQMCQYQRLISTMALPNLVDSLIDPPEAVLQARHRLRANEVVYLNVGLRKPVGQPDHWIYVPELKFPIYRVGSFSNANPNMVPPGCGSLYVELSDRKTPLEELEPMITSTLSEMGLIKTADDILFMHERRIPNAYVLYDFHYQSARKTIMDFLHSEGIESIGRYGDWNYSSMEDALIDGRNAGSNGCG